MIGVLYECCRCDQKYLVRLSGDQVYSRIRVKDTYPLGWQIRTPRQGISAMAYCPRHRDDEK